MLPISCERWPSVSMTLAVLLSEVAICCSDEDASSIEVRPMRVCWAFSWARRSVLPMLSAMFIDVALNSSTAPAMLVISPDCCSMPSNAPPDRPDNALARVLTSCAAVRICDTIDDSASLILLKLPDSCPISSLLVTFRRTLRSPAPSASAWRTSSDSGRSLLRSNQMALITAMSMASRLPIASCVPTCQVTSLISLRGMLAMTVQGPPANGWPTL